VTITAGELLRRVLMAAGVDGVYGAQFGTLEATQVPARVAELFAAAHHRVHGVRAAVYRGDGIFALPPIEAGNRLCIAAESADELIAAVPLLCSPCEVELRVSLDPDGQVADLAPASAPAEERWVDPARDTVEALRRAPSVTVLAGPGVVRHDAVSGLHDLAFAAGVGVLNTWGAKGVFDWRSRHHLATVGLQERDFELGGLGEVDLIIATGLDPLEAPDARWELAPALRVAPGALAQLAENAGDMRRSPAMPPVRALLAQVTQRGWTKEEAPLSPSRVTMNYAECLGTDGLLAADAGTAGFWVARTFGTTRLGAVIVPSAPTPGFAAACVAVARLRRHARSALAVVDAPVDAQTFAVVDAAASLDVEVPVEIWDPDGEKLDAEAHRLRLRRLVLGRATGADPSGGPGKADQHTLATDPAQLPEIVDVAGPIIAWT
jgi:hypothetical protein